MVQISADVLINYILIFFILLLFLVLTRRLSNKEAGDGYFVMLKSQNTFNLSLSFYASGMGLWIIASPAEVGWYGLGFDVIGYAISAATPFGLLYFLGPKIVDAVKRTLERTPPELAADIVDRGIMLAGGGALVRGISDLLSHETGIFTHVAEDPLLCVVNGCGLVLDDFKSMRRVLDTPDFARNVIRD